MQGKINANAEHRQDFHVAGDYYDHFNNAILKTDDRSNNDDYDYNYAIPNNTSDSISRFSVFAEPCLHESSIFCNVWGKSGQRN
mmetsp:Transcript_17633/g.38522  ORF Transcript_17633/g.38522 Transcript_17633/m.38522 type:complete len:84 (-) Transcript_17633:687-938(-)